MSPNFAVLKFLFVWGINIKTSKWIKELYVWGEKIHIGMLNFFFFTEDTYWQVESYQPVKQYADSCLLYTSAKILIFNISWLCFLLLSLIALCFGVFPSDTMISNAFSVYLLKFICDTYSSFSPSSLRRLPWLVNLSFLLSSTYSFWDCLFSIFLGFRAF